MPLLLDNQFILSIHLVVNRIKFYKFFKKIVGSPTS